MIQIFLFGARANGQWFILQVGKEKRTPPDGPRQPICEQAQACLRNLSSRPAEWGWQWQLNAPGGWGGRGVRRQKEQLLCLGQMLFGAGHVDIYKHSGGDPRGLKHIHPHTWAFNVGTDGGGGTA